MSIYRYDLPLQAKFAAMRARMAKRPSYTRTRRKSAQHKRERILLRAGEDQLLGPRFAGKAEKS